MEINYFWTTVKIVWIILLQYVAYFTLNLNQYNEYVYTHIELQKFYYSKHKPLKKWNK